MKQTQNSETGKLTNFTTEKAKSKAEKKEDEPINLIEGGKAKEERGKRETGLHNVNFSGSH